MNFLVNAGAKADYVEANTSGHLKCLPGCYRDMSAGETHIQYYGARYYFRGNFPEGNNFTVIDFGTIAECKLQTLKQCEVIVLCGTTKPYEIASVKAAVEEFGNLPLSLVMSFASKKEQMDMNDMLARGNVKVYFSEYSPDLFDGKVNSRIYTEILSGYLQEKNG